MNFILFNNCLAPNSSYISIKCDILIGNQKIIDIAPEIKDYPDNTKVINIKEKYVLPGFIDCHTHLGIMEEATGKIGIDNNEISEAVTPQIRGIDAINPMDVGFRDAIQSGITTIMSGPGSNNAVCGLSVAIKTYGRIIDDMVIKNPVGLKVALGENPITTYGKEGKCPVTRMGTASLIRELFMEVQDYIELKKLGRLEKRKIKLEAVIPVLKGELPLRVHAHRADDIVTAIRIADEFGISKLVIEHGTEAHLVKDFLKTKEVPVAFGPMLTPRIKMELKSRNYRSALELVEAGVKVALITDHPYNSIEQLRTVTALAIAEGLNKNEALKCLTVHPAEILDCGQRVGRIQKGYDADMVVFDSEPFDIRSKVVMTIINGRIVWDKENGLNTCSVIN